jgi:hypothetical protein
METRNRGIILAITLFASLIAILAACADPSSWELVGEVKIIALREATDAQDVKKAILDYSIRNVGKSRIEACSFALTFSTDRNSYHHTVVDENSIRGGAWIYGQVSIQYNAPDEIGTLAGAVVDSVQFM